jgi:hypothetical protein
MLSSSSALPVSAKRSFISISRPTPSQNLDADGVIEVIY